MTDDFTGPEPGEDGGWGSAPPAQAKPEARPEALDSLSSIEIDTTAKGDPKVRVKVYARSNEPLEVQRAADVGIDLYKKARGQLREPVA